MIAVGFTESVPAALEMLVDHVSVLRADVVGKE